MVSPGLVEREVPIGLGVATVDGIVLRANHALALCLGCAGPWELIGTSLRRFHSFPELAADVLRERFDANLSDPVEIDGVRADGSPLALRIRGRYLTMEDGSTAVVFSAEDVSEQREAREESTQGHKMEAVVRFAAGVAHDYNNLLTGVIGEATQLLADLPAGSDGHESAREIIHAARRASDITRRLLVFSKSEVARTETVDVDELVRAAVPQLEETLTGDVALVLRLGESAGLVRLDPAQLRQILENLVTNARDALPGGGRIVIETSVMDAPRDTAGIDFDPKVPAGRYLSLAVGDDGIGMNQETVRRIFDPFYTTKPIGGGAGLGLTTVYGHVLRSGGHVSVLSAPAHGTLVRMLFPFATQATGTVPSPSSATAARDAGSRTILVVDDERTVLRVMTKVLQRAGYQILQASDAFAAQEVVRALDGPLDLLVTDVMMPRMKGTELAQWTQNHLPDTQVLLVSGYTDAGVVQEWVDEDPDVFLAKPFEPEELLQRVESRLAGSPS